MGKKLNQDEYYNSIDALGDFAQCKGGDIFYINNKVLAYKGKDIIANVKCDIMLVLDDPRNIQIHWEDDENFQDYKSYGLWGIYDSRYCKMEFDENKETLTIHSDNNVDVIVC